MQNDMRNEMQNDIQIRNITAEDVWSRIPQRKQDSHKGTFGKALCVAGSSRYRGAASLTIEGALRSGCGIVTLASVEEVFPSIQARLPECILLLCEHDKDGGISDSNLEKLCKERDNDYSALLMGPGMGNTASTAGLVRELASTASCTVILDADALNSLTYGTSPSRPGSLPGTGTGSSAAASGAFNPEGPFPGAIPHPAGGHKAIITPHPGEMARLCGCTIADIKAAPEKISLSFAKQNDCIVVLKGHRTLVASPDGQLWRNTTGNSGLARGGSGDILAGMTASLAAQHLDPMSVAICAVWLHGEAAVKCSMRKSQTAMLPHDIFEDLGQLFLERKL